MQKNRIDGKVINLLVVISSLFLLLAGYLTYFRLAVGDGIVSNSYNRRQWEKEESTIRGSIYDRNGTLLAKSEKKDGRSERVYPFGALYSHVIGYNSRAYGRTLIESAYNEYLLDSGGISSVFKKASNKSQEATGNSIYLTIDHRLQKKASDLLTGKNGAIIAMNPSTGEILAMVSKPDFNPNTQSLAEKWQELAESDSYPFYSRATQGLYAPGSTFKIVTAATALEAGLNDFKFKDTGSITIDGKVFSNFNGDVYGSLDLKHAFSVSSNAVFAKLGVELGFEKLKNNAMKMLFSKIPFDLPLKESVFPARSLSDADTAATAIGQGRLLVTPLQIAAMTSCIANGGVMVQPRLVSTVKSSQGEMVKEWKPAMLGRKVSAKVAAEVAAMMRETVVSGTGKKASVSGVHVAGKTGTAENELSTENKGNEHAWFTCFAPYEKPEIVVTVILEYSGSTGGNAAAPIAGKLVREYMKYYK